MPSYVLPANQTVLVSTVPAIESGWRPASSSGGHIAVDVVLAPGATLTPVQACKTLQNAAKRQTGGVLADSTARVIVETTTALAATLQIARKWFGANGYSEQITLSSRPVAACSTRADDCVRAGVAVGTPIPGIFAVPGAPRGWAVTTEEDAEGRTVRVVLVRQ